MTKMIGADMIEATRLTRAGKITEATALLLRLVQNQSDPTFRAEEDQGPAGPPTNNAQGLIEAAGEIIAPPPRKRSRPRRWVEDIAARGATDAEIIPRQRAKPAAPPKGGRFLTASFTCEAGTRAYKLYVPSAYHGQPRPLIVMLHGCTQSADDFATGTRMNVAGEENGCFVAYPIQSSSANHSKCWNWFNPADQRRGQGEPSLIAGITRQIMADYAIDPARVYVAGLSAGGAAAALVAAAYPDLFAAAGVHSGLACGAANGLSSAFAAMQNGGAEGPAAPSRGRGFDKGPLVPTIVFHGDKDATVHPRNGAQVIEQSFSKGLANLRAATLLGQAPGGRAYTRTTYRDAAGLAALEMWVIHGAGHAWSGGDPAGSYTDPSGPDASREMMRFFLGHKRPAARPG